MIEERHDYILNLTKTWTNQTISHFFAKNLNHNKSLEKISHF